MNNNDNLHTQPPPTTEEPPSTSTSTLGEELRRLRDKYIQEGGKLLSPEQLDEEIQSRR